VRHVADQRMLAKSCRTADQYWRPSEIEETTRKVALAGQKRRKRQRAGGHQRWPQSCRSAFIRSPTTHAGDQSLSDTRDTPDRSILPLAEPQYPAITEVDARKATPPPRFELKPPKGAGAPNVVFILMDNFGFGDPGCFGGPVNMPAFERLANGGLRYNNMHTAPVCSPTRVALLTGRNSHSANMGGVAEMGTAFPGKNCVRPQSVAPLAEILRLNGYGTAMFGKSHELPPWN
jgi:hypothetical protein